MKFIKELWLKNVYCVLDAIADRDVLHDAWSGKSDYPTTPEEIYNEVFSDAHVAGYADPDLALDETQKAAGKEFVRPYAGLRQDRRSRTAVAGSDRPPRLDQGTRSCPEVPRSASACHLTAVFSRAMRMGGPFEVNASMLIDANPILPGPVLPDREPNSR